MSPRRLVRRRKQAFRPEWVADLGNLSALDLLCRFVPTPVVEAILSDRMTEILGPHQQEVIVVFLDLRGFTAFVETTPPAEVARVLRAYHHLVGRTVTACGGTLEHFTGDGTMIFFSESASVPGATDRAVRMALSLRSGFVGLARRWRVCGHVLGLGAGVSKGYATIGIIGFDGRWDFGVIGPVTNLAARLCQIARAGEILICPRVASELSAEIPTERVSEVRVKGLQQKVEIFRV
jgi:adenylate cyclase